MFTGIIKCAGTVLADSEAGGDRRLTIGFDPSLIGRPEPGASIAVNGVCLTATRVAEGQFDADVSSETLAVTTLADLRAGGRVNLEPSLCVGDPMDGHLVSGHVDGVGRIVRVGTAARSSVFTIAFAPELGRFIARKGSIAVDGVSLTVNAVRTGEFDVNIVPHTQRLTISGSYERGAAVNLEVDMIARYLERLVHTEAPETGVSLAALQEHGFAKHE